MTFLMRHQKQQSGSKRDQITTDIDHLGVIKISWVPIGTTIFLTTIVALYLAMSVRRSVGPSVRSNEFLGV